MFFKIYELKDPDQKRQNIMKKKQVIRIFKLLNIWIKYLWFQWSSGGQWWYCTLEPAGGFPVWYFNKTALVPLSVLCETFSPTEAEAADTITNRFLFLKTAWGGGLLHRAPVSPPQTDKRVPTTSEEHLKLKFYCLGLWCRYLLLSCSPTVHTVG